MASLDDHERRIGALEERVQMEAGLRASQDNDLASLGAQVKVHGRLLKAVAATQSQHGRQLTRLENDMSDVKSRLGVVETELGVVKTELGLVKVGVHQILGLLNRLVDDDERGR